MEQIKDFNQLIQEVQNRTTPTIAIAGSCNENILKAAYNAQKNKVANCILIGDQSQTEQIAKNNSLSIQDMEFVHVQTSSEAAELAIQYICEGKAQIGMRGTCELEEMLHFANHEKKGILHDGMVSHISVAEIPKFDRLIMVTDAGINVAPNAEEKIGIVQNAIQVALKLGVTQPKVAVLAATEMVNFKIPLSIEAACLAKMAQRGQISGGLVDGPLALDNAISMQAAKIKGIKSSVAGQADILIAPDIEAGNLLLKTITYFAKGTYAGVVVGLKAPIVVVSRADLYDTETSSIALAALLATEAEE